MELCHDCEIDGVPGCPYLRGCILYAFGALASGPHAVPAVIAEPDRVLAITTAQANFEKDTSAASVAMAEQCKLMLIEAEIEPEKEASLFEPWDSEFNIDTGIEEHSWEPTFFSKLT
jgi:hypothetical protein